MFIATKNAEIDPYSGHDYLFAKQNLFSLWDVMHVPVRFVMFGYLEGSLVANL